MSAAYLTTSSRIMLPVKRLHISCLSPCWHHKVRLLSLWRFASCHPSSAHSGHGEHSGAEEAAHGSGHLHEDSGLLLHRHLLRSTIQRGRVTERLLLVIHFLCAFVAVCLFGERSEGKYLNIFHSAKTVNSPLFNQSGQSHSNLSQSGLEEVMDIKTKTV